MDALTAEGKLGAAVLHMAGITAGYGGEPVLCEVNLDVQLGEWVALLGPNGSGKSTLLYCIAGLLRPMAGDIEVCGVSLAHDAASGKRFLGYGCAPEQIPPLLTGRQCLEVYAAAKGVREIDATVLELLKVFAMAPLLDQFVDTYSLGTRQKLAALLGLVGAPKLILLDEAFNGLDPASGRALRRHLRSLVEARRASVLLATHALDVVERYADRAALLLSGRIAREWSGAELSGFRSSVGTLEEAVSAASEAYLGGLR